MIASLFPSMASIVLWVQHAFSWNHATALHSCKQFNLSLLSPKHHSLRQTLKTIRFCLRTMLTSSLAVIRYILFYSNVKKLTWLIKVLFISQTSNSWSLNLFGPFCSFYMRWILRLTRHTSEVNNNLPYSCYWPSLSFQWVFFSSSRIGSNMASEVQFDRSLPEKPSVLWPSRYQSSVVNDAGVAAKCIFINVMRASL